jgi:hypothetical protein
MLKRRPPRGRPRGKIWCRATKELRSELIRILILVLLELLIVHSLAAAIS